MKFTTLTFFISCFLCFTSCKQSGEFSTNFDNTNDRIWIGKDFWSIPLEDWKIENGKLHSTGSVPNSRVNLLTHVLSPEKGNFNVSMKINLIEKGNAPGSAGLLIGVHDKEDSDVRAACYFGKGIHAGVNLNGFAYLNDERLQLADDFDYTDFSVEVSGNDAHLKLEVRDINKKETYSLETSVNGLQGLIAVSSNQVPGGNEKAGNSKFSFDDLTVSGSKVISNSENAFGPILWTMHTLSNETLKIMAMLPPLGENDNKQVSLHFMENGSWKRAATENIEPDSRTALFRVENWNATNEREYRIEYIEKEKGGNEIPYYYEGVIRKEPTDRPLKLGGLTCQYHYGFPYTPLVQNLEELNPDILYFSGDQIYEGNGGYPIKREPEDVSILSYLGKYYMFGWAFGDIMRDRPTICTPDDHDVFHGNLWGQGGIAKPGGIASDDTRGFVQSVKMVNAVNLSQCGHLPDPYDPTPIDQGMSVWYAGLTYGRVSFAIISDRIFKTGPEAVSDWEGRKDHMKEPREDLSFLDKQGVEMIGERQIRFLNDWVTNWKGADMKVLLSQTVFANVATHHGNLDNYLYGDLDSGGWPKVGRDRIIRLMRKAAAFHINGDQHVPSLVQYGLTDYCDAGWSYCTPAIAVGYQRWFLPDELNVPVIDRPEHGYPNTGKYSDAFGNKNFVYAIGNPGKITSDRESRYNQALIRSSGFGMVTFDQSERTINIDAWRFKADVNNPNPVRDQFPGWPLRISQFDNLGTGAENFLPEFSINKPNQLVEIRNEKTGELVQIYRIKGNKVQPKLHESGTFSITIGEDGNKQTISNINSQTSRNENQVSVNL